jgi:choline-sulfatase
VPLIINWPGHVPAKVDEDLCEGLDLARTLFGLCGIDPPAQFKGRDLLTSDAPSAVYSTIGYGFASSRAFPNLNKGGGSDGHGWPRRACVRTQRWRLDKTVRLDGRRVSPQMEDVFLADVHADPDEVTNVAGDPQNADVLASLERMLERHVQGAVEVAEADVSREKKTAVAKEV